MGGIKLFVVYGEVCVGVDFIWLYWVCVFYLVGIWNVCNVVE